MAKSIPKIGSRKTGRIGSRKHPRKIPKGVIYIQASFNNTIVTLTDVRGRVISWSSADSCGFKGTRRGTPFAALTAARNAIQKGIDQGMQRAEVRIKGPGLGREAALRAIRRSGILFKCSSSRVRVISVLVHEANRVAHGKEHVREKDQTSSLRTEPWFPFLYYVTPPHQQTFPE